MLFVMSIVWFVYYSYYIYGMIRCRDDFEFNKSNMLIFTSFTLVTVLFLFTVICFYTDFMRGLIESEAFWVNVLTFIKSILL